MTPALDIDWLRRSGAEPQWFGLGFVQLKLDDTHRVHFYSDALAPDTPPDEVHDHRYGFTSRVLLGQVRQTLFDFTPDPAGDWMCAEVSCDPANPLPPGGGVRGRVEMTSSAVMAVGSRYSVIARQFHTFEAARAVTHLSREATRLPHARVCRPIGVEAVCPFSNPRPAEFLWSIIADLLLDAEA